MNKNIINALAFVAGAAVGSVATWYFLKTKYERMLDDEVQSVKEAFSNYEKLPEKREEEVVEDRFAEKNKIKEYENIANNYIRIKKEENDSSMSEIDKPYVIAPDEYGELPDYEQQSLTFHSNGIITDEFGEVVDDADDLVGKDIEDHFGEYEEDAVHIRNDSTMVDYEILRVEEPYIGN